MRLYLMRHGPAEDVAESGRDFDRALTAAGRGRVQRVAELLLDGGDYPARIVTSPLVRARETAAIVARCCNLEAPSIDPSLAAGHDARGLVDGLIAGEDEGARIMLVGHEPDMTHLAEHAVLGAHAFPGFDKGEIVFLDVSPAARALLRTLDPRELRFR